MIEKPNTPHHDANNRNKHKAIGPKPNSMKFCGCKCTIIATTQPVNVATVITIMAKVPRSKPERISCLAISRPEVMNGNPGMTNNIAPI